MLPEPGTIDDVKTRLARWGRLAPQGLARVEFVSEPSRQRVVEDLREIFAKDGIPFREIRLPQNQTPGKLVHDLVARFSELEPGVVSLIGFELAFPDGRDRAKALSVLNFNRESLALHPLRQIWWMTPLFAETFLHSVPDLDSWFMLRLRLMEFVPAPNSDMLLPQPIQGGAMSLNAARQISAELVTRFETARLREASARQLLDLAITAINVLLRARATREARELYERLFSELTDDGRDLAALAAWNPETSADLAAIAKTINNAAYLLHGLGNLDHAEHLNRIVLDFRERVLRPDHPDLAVSLNNLASVYRDKQQFTKAEEMLQRALAIDQASYGPQHPEVAIDLHNLATVLDSQGEFEAAERYYRQALEVYETGLGPAYANLAIVLGSLGALYHREGRLAEARPAYERALSIAEKALGEEHLTTARLLTQLALLFEAEEHYLDAEPLLERALAICKNLLGSENLETLANLVTLARVYTHQGKYPSAEPLLDQALRNSERILGEDHVLVAARLHDLASLHLAQGEPQAALPLQARAMAILDRLSVSLANQNTSQSQAECES